jgi:hypothetical protein
MFTPSIVFLMILNIVAVSGAVFAALRASALETRDSTIIENAGIAAPAFIKIGLLPELPRPEVEGKPLL